MKEEVGMKLDIDKPEKDCGDDNCPFHGTISVRGRTFKGTVSNDEMTKTASVEWDRKVFVPKFERYEMRKTVVKAHNPECVDVDEGDKVMIAETRPISKTKSFVIVKKMEENKEGE